MFTILAMAAAAAAAPINPLEPAERGQLECSDPDPRRKTCTSLSSYRLEADGYYTAIATVLMMEEPRLTLAIGIRLRLVSGEVCGRLTPADLGRAKVTAPERTFRLKEEAFLLAEMTKLWQAMGMLDRELCSTYRQDGQEFVTRTSIEGQARPDLDQRIRWVSPQDGYRLVSMLPQGGEHVEPVQ